MPECVVVEREIWDSVMDWVHGMPGTKIETLILDGGEADVWVTLHKGLVDYTWFGPDGPDENHAFYKSKFSRMVEIDEDLWHALWKNAMGRRHIVTELSKILLTHDAESDIL